MSSRSRPSVKSVSKALVFLLLAVQALDSLMHNPLMNAYSADIVNYAGFRSAAEVRAAAERNIAGATAALDTAAIESTPPAALVDVNEPIAQNPLPIAAEVQRVAAPDIPPTVEALPPDGPLMVTLADRSLDASSLDDIRGGFEPVGSSLKFSFGIERAVFINGQLVASTVLNLKDLQWVAGSGSAPQVLTSGAAAAAGALSVVQSGAGNSFAAQAGANLAGTVIQNTLNDQKIQNVTTINAAVNSAQLLRAMSVQSAVQSGIVSSLRR